MIKFITSDKFLDQAANAYAVFVEQDFKFDQLSEISKKFFPALKDALKQREFTGKAHSNLVLTSADDSKLIYLIFIGLGKVNKTMCDLESYRRALASVIRIAQSYKIEKLAIQLPDSKLFNAEVEEFSKETAVISLMSEYDFDDFKTDEEKKKKSDINLIICSDKKNIAQIKKGIEIGEFIGQCVNKARYWCDMPPAHKYPKILADYAKSLEKETDLKVTVFDSEQISKMGMGGIEGVCKGSEQKPRLVVMEHKAANKNAKKVVLVGKGVTFDSGGLSLKPANAMETMKDDMAGAAVVTAAMRIISKLKLNINVIGITPLVENMPSGSATRPGDILKFYNGKTAEVKNTDAEGRLILADALSYAVKHYKPDAIIDFATLTGACSYALGPFYCGLMTKHDDLAEKLKRASLTTGERVWSLPLDDDYKKAVRSEIADICNIGNERYRAGAITAAFFLQNFVDDVPWVHLDIAGTAYGVPDIAYYRNGATAFGVRLIVDALICW
ncbi:leucyl aminopeptidase [Candidatus Dependentiae bacterium]|nr:leucyl aminopeptidase [Candidatus Dependentiae bacterium]